MRINGLEKYFNTDESGEIVDFKQNGIFGMSPLMLALRNNKKNNLNLSDEQWDYLIKNSNLKQFTIGRWSPLMYALENKQEENLNLTKEQWKYLIDNSDLTLIKDKKQLIELKKIQSELLNCKIFNKVDINKIINKKVKI